MKANYWKVSSPARDFIVWGVTDKWKQAGKATVALVPTLNLAQNSNIKTSIFSRLSRVSLLYQKIQYMLLLAHVAVTSMEIKPQRLFDSDQLCTKQIKHPRYRQLDFSEHLEICTRNLMPNFKIFPIYQCPYNIRMHQRQNKETIFIHKYRSQINMKCYLTLNELGHTKLVTSPI